MKEKNKVSIVLLTYNGEKYLQEVLESIFAQKVSFKFEVLVIDSGSSDSSLKIIKQFPVRLKQIPNKEFNHGKTRNLGVEESDGEIVVFLTQDATPANEHWLGNLVQNFDIDNNVAAVYGLQIPRGDCDPFTKRDMIEYFKMMGPLDRATFRSLKTRKQKEEFEINEGVVGFYSDVNSALRRSAWKQFPYRELEYAEDQAFGRDILKAGYTKVFEPRASVIHSHSYPLRDYLKRQYDEYLGLKKAVGFIAKDSLIQVLGGTVRGTLFESMYILRDRELGLFARLKWIPYSFSTNFLKRFASYLAAKENRLPKFFSSRLSLEKSKKKLTRQR
jgi:rhamnosyltransferase